MQEFNTYKASWSAKRRLKVIELLGGKCLHCGFTDVRALQLDHINGGGSKVRDGKNHNNMITKYLKDIELAKEEVQVLCANCNWIKRYENRECNHHHQLYGELEN